MKWRNQMLALVCLLAFAGLGILYFQHWVVQKPFGIILFIGEGLTPQRLAMTRVFVGGADGRLALDSMPHLALMTNYSSDFAAPDQAAAASAIATGTKTANRALSIDDKQKALTTIIEAARARGRGTGLITNGQLTDPTCAAFYAHRPDAYDTAEIAKQLAESNLFDIVMGGGFAQFLPPGKGGTRSDGRDLLLELRGNGFDLVNNRAELEAIPLYHPPKLFGAFAPGEMAFANQLEAKKDQPALADMVRRAVELLQYNQRGYLLVVDAGLMRKAAQENAAEGTLAETAELDRAVATARRYAGPGSTVIVCGDAGVGGLSLNGFPFRKDSGIALLGLNSAGQPWMTWATGPKGFKVYGAARLAEKQESAVPPESADAAEPAAVYARGAFNTVDDVIALGDGPGTQALQGIIDNTAIFKIIQGQF